MPIQLIENLIQVSEVLADTAEITACTIDMLLQRITVRVKYSFANTQVLQKTYIIKGNDFMELAHSVPVGNTMYGAIKSSLYKYFFDNGIIKGSEQ